MIPLSKTNERCAFTLLEHAVLFLGACIAIGCAAGVSPAINIDTAVEESFVRWCLKRGACPLFGGPAAFAGFWQGGAWIYVRTFFSWIGLTIPATHLALVGLDALGITLVAATGARLGGRVAGLFAAASALFILMGADSLCTSVHNSRFIFFPGCLCISLCVRAAETARLRFALLAAAVAASAVNTHLSTFTLAFPVVFAGAQCARRNPLRLIAPAAVMGVLAFAYAPGLWLYTFTHLDGTVAELPRQLSGFSGLIGAEKWGLAAVVALVVTRIGPGIDVARRRPLDVLLVALVLGLGVYFAARQVLEIRQTERYVLHLIPAVALGFTPAIGAVLTRLRDALVPNPEADARAAPVRLGVRMAPYLAAIMFILLCSGARRDALALTYADLRDVKEHLSHGLGWSLGELYRQLKGPGGPGLIAAIATSSDLDEYDRPGPRGAHPAAHVVKTRARNLPAAMPPGWKVFQRPGGVALVIAVEPTWIDWARFEVCPSRAEAARCLESGLTLHSAAYLGVTDPVPHLPPFRPGEVTPLVMRFHTSMPGDGTAQELRIPSDPHLCRGEIVAAPGSGTVLDDGGQRAVLRAAPGSAGEEGVVVIEWFIGGPACHGPSYEEHPPWFIEAPPDEARLMAGLLAGRR